jgi:hypothetical protein
MAEEKKKGDGEIDKVTSRLLATAFPPSGPRSLSQRLSSVRVVFTWIGAQKKKNNTLAAKRVFF